MSEAAGRNIWDILGTPPGAPLVSGESQNTVTTTGNTAQNISDAVDSAPLITPS